MPSDLPGREEPCLPDPPGTRSLSYVNLTYIMQSKGRETQALKRFINSLITLPKELPPSPSY